MTQEVWEPNNIAPFVSTQQVDLRILLFLIYYTKKHWFWTIIHPFICRGEICVMFYSSANVRRGQICS